MEDHMLLARPSATGHEHASGSLQQQVIIDQTAAVKPRGRSRRSRAHLAPWQANVARDMMESRMASGLALADVAGRLHMSVNHFIKAFRETEGVAPYHWYMQRRIGQAMAMLRDDKVPLSRVADECGFADQSHFTKAFTRLIGISPGQWRQNGTNTSNTGN